MIHIIRGSRSVQIAKQELIDRFELTDVQAQAIVDMRLRALTGLEREKLEAEYKELMEQISRLILEELQKDIQGRSWQSFFKNMAFLPHWFLLEETFRR